MTTTELAAAAYVSQSLVSHFENRTRNLRGHMLVYLQKTLEEKGIVFHDCGITWQQETGIRNETIARLKAEDRKSAVPPQPAGQRSGPP
jgi:hypothetical protein